MTDARRNLACSLAAAGAACLALGLARLAGIPPRWDLAALAVGPAVVALAGIPLLGSAMSRAAPDRETVHGLMTLIGTSAIMIGLAPLAATMLGHLP